MATEGIPPASPHVVAGFCSSVLDPREVAPATEPVIGDDSEPVQSDDEVDLEVGTAAVGDNTTEHAQNSASTSASAADLPPGLVVGQPCSISSHVVEGLEQDVARITAASQVWWQAELDPNESPSAQSLRSRRMFTWWCMNSCSLLQILVTLANIGVKDEHTLFLFFGFQLLRPQVDAMVRSLCLSTQWGWPVVLYLWMSELSQLGVLVTFCKQENARRTLLVLAALTMSFVVLHQHLIGWKMERTEAPLRDRLRSSLAIGIIRFVLAAPAMTSIFFMQEAPYRSVAYMLALVIYYWLANLSLQVRTLRAAGSKSGMEFEKKMLFQGVADMNFFLVAGAVHAAQLLCAWLWWHHPADKETYDVVVALYLMGISVLGFTVFCFNVCFRCLENNKSIAKYWRHS